MKYAVLTFCYLGNQYLVCYSKSPVQESKVSNGNSSIMLRFENSSIEKSLLEKNSHP